MSRGQDIWSDKGRGDFETEIVYKATTKSGDVCCFGNKVLASAWAGRGTVEPISVKTKTCEIAYPSEKMVQSIRLVADNSADEIKSLRQQLTDLTMTMREVVIEQKQQLAASQVREVMLRGAVESLSALGMMGIYNGVPHWIFPMTVCRRADEALAATADLDRFVLCEKGPVVYFLPVTKQTIIASKVPCPANWMEPLYRAREPK